MQILTHDQETEFVKQNRFKESECSCSSCKQMCKRAPCLGTPTEIIKIIEAGFADKLGATLQATQTVLTGDAPVEIIAPIFNDKQGACSFYKDGNCELHNLGLKPIEGMLANHSNEIISYKQSCVPNILELWNVSINPYNVTKAWLLFAHANHII